MAIYASITLKCKKCEKAVDTCPFTLDYVPDYYKADKVYKKVVFKERFMLKINSIDIRINKRVVKLLILFYNY